MAKILVSADMLWQEGCSQWIEVLIATVANSQLPESMQGLEGWNDGRPERAGELQIKLLELDTASEQFCESLRRVGCGERAIGGGGADGQRPGVAPIGLWYVGEEGTERLLRTQGHILLLSVRHGEQQVHQDTHFEEGRDAEGIGVSAGVGEVLCIVELEEVDDGVSEFCRELGVGSSHGMKC